MTSKKSVVFLFLGALLLMSAGPANAVWVWSKDTGTFRNVDDLVKANSKEQFDYAEDYEKKSNFDQAYKEYQKLVKHFPDSVLAGRAQFRSARCLEKIGRYSKAFKMYQAVLDKYPDFDQMDNVLDRQFAIAEMYYHGKKKELPFIGIRLFSGKSDAVKFFNQIAENAPFSKYAEKGKFMAGVILEDLGRYEDDSDGQGATNTYRYVVEHFPDGEFADDAQYRIAMCYYIVAGKSRHNNKAFAGAIRNFKKYIRLYPTGEFVEEAKKKISELDFRTAKSTFEVGEYYEKHKKVDSALIYYREVVEKYPLSEWAEKAEEKINTLSPKEQEGES